MQQQLITSTLFLLGCSVIAMAQTARTFPHPDRIRYDGQCLTIDGKDTFIFSGAFHMFRCPKELWRERFQTIKDAGFNCVETYVAWNWHEREMPRDVSDFSHVDLTDLRDWMKMAHDEFGLYTIIRPGPYICAEWAAGGFPMWLILKRPADTTREPWLRSDDPTYLAWSKHWMDAVCPVIAPQQVTRRKPGTGGTILVQIENEYDSFGPLTDAQRSAHLASLRDAAQANGIDVPLITCWTNQVRTARTGPLRDAFDSITNYPRWNVAGTGRELDELGTAQPDAPKMAIELQGGWFSNVGGKLSADQDGLTAPAENAITMTAIAHGATILNYYMLFGGTNFGDWAGRNMTTTYDYAAPIAEDGSTGDKYAVVKAIGQMLQQFGPRLARSQPIACTLDGVDSDLQISARQATDGTRFIFAWNKSRHDAAKKTLHLKLAGDSIDLSCDLPPFDYKMLVLKPGDHAGQWWPKTVAGESRASQTIATITSALVRDDPGGEEWTLLPADGNIARAGIFDSRYIVYRAHATLSDSQARELRSLQLNLLAADPIVARVNGKIFAASSASHRLIVPVPGALHAGENEITLLYENAGYGNYGVIAMPAGLVDAQLVHTDHSGDLSLENWRVKLIDDHRAPDPALLLADVDDSSWPAFALDSKTIDAMDDAKSTDPSVLAARALFHRDNAHAVFRCNFDRDEKLLASERTRIIFESIDDDEVVYINGKEAVRSSDYRKPLVIDATPFLHGGKNVIAVDVHNGDGPGGLTDRVRLESTATDGVPLSWQLAPDLVGAKQRWFDPALDVSTNWRRVPFDSTPNSTVLATWFRCDFAVPDRSSGDCATHFADINASGNGMLYLNGHPLGRWWEIGPQRKFYLPGCWLNFGRDKKNVLTFCMCPTAKSAAGIHSIGIEQRRPR